MQCAVTSRKTAGSILYPVIKLKLSNKNWNSRKLVYAMMGSSGFPKFRNCSDETLVIFTNVGVLTVHDESESTFGGEAYSEN